MSQHFPVPDEVLERCLACLGTRGIARATAGCAQWRRVGEKPAVWLPAVLRGVRKAPYATSVTSEGAAVWLQRELGGQIDSAKGHLIRLQQSRRLSQLLRYLTNFHNGVEVEPHNARRAPSWYSSSSVNVTVTLEILSFWPHASWVLVRTLLPFAEEGEAEGEEPDLQGTTVRMRSWDSALLPPGRLGKGFCHLLDLGPRGELFRVQGLSRLEIGAHRISGHEMDGGLRLECTMGRWDDELQLPLPPCTRDAFLHTTTGDSALTPEGYEDVVDAREPLDISWFEGRPWPGSAVLGPALYRSVIDLDVSMWV